MTPNITTNFASASLTVSLACEVASAGCFLSATAAPRGGDGALSTAEFTELLLKHSAPAPLPPVWKFLGRSDVIRRLRRPPAELALALQNEHPVERLLSSRILVRAANGELDRSPVLGDRRSKFLMILDPKQNLTDVVSARGAMISWDPPFFRRGVRPKDQERPRRLYLASSDDDLQILNGLGFRVTTTAGLAGMNAEQVRRLLGKPKNPSQQNQLILVGWNVGAVGRDMPKQLPEVLQHIWDIESVFEYHPLVMPFCLWHPSEEEFARIRAAISFGSRAVVRRVFNTSTDASAPAVEAWNLLLDAADTDLVTAEKELQRVIEKPGLMPKSEEAKRALRRYMAAVDRATCDKFLEAAGASPDPLEAARLLLAKEVVDDLAKSQPIVHSAKQVIDNQHPAPLKLTSEEQAERRQLLGSLLRIHKALGRTK